MSTDSVCYLLNLTFFKYNLSLMRHENSLRDMKASYATAQFLTQHVLGLCNILTRHNRKVHSIGPVGCPPDLPVNRSFCRHLIAIPSSSFVKVGRTELLLVRVHNIIVILIGKKVGKTREKAQTPTNPHFIRTGLFWKVLSSLMYLGIRGQFEMETPRARLI